MLELQKKKKGKTEVDKNSQECFLKRIPLFPKVNTEMDYKNKTKPKIKKKKRRGRKKRKGALSVKEILYAERAITNLFMHPRTSLV